MKKSLFAVAAVTAFAGAAQAQSSVTVYGLLDVGYVGGNTRVSDSIKANTAGYNGGQTKTTANQFGQSAESTSRLGFKGVEDLGGGTSAFFTAEFALAPQDQTLSGNQSSTSNQAGLNNRQAFVGLKKAGIGQTALGLQQTGVFNAVAATDPGQMNNIVGNVIYAGNTSVTASNAGTGSVGFTNRTANTLTFKTDNFAGFTANALWTLNNKNATQTTQANTTATVDKVTGLPVAATGQATTGGMTNSSGWGLGADYTFKKFYINAQYQSFKQLTTANNTAANAQVWTAQSGNGATTAPTGTAQAQDVQDNQFYLGATYDFGILKAYAQYLNRKATSTANTNYYLKRQAEQIGVRSFITPTIEAWASAGLGRYTAMGEANPTVNFNAWQLGSNYYLSKRTNLYAIYGQTLTSTGNYGSGTNATTISGGASNYAVGVRHTF